MLYRTWVYRVSRRTRGDRPSSKPSWMHPRLARLFLWYLSSASPNRAESLFGAKSETLHPVQTHSTSLFRWIEEGYLYDIHSMVIDPDQGFKEARTSGKMVFQGGVAIGSASWGAVASRFDLPNGLCDCGPKLSSLLLEGSGFALQSTPGEE